MSYQARLQEDVKAAMRSGDTVVRDTLRMLMAALKNKRIELGRDLDEKDQLQVLQKQKKSREDSLAQYGAAGRADLAAREQAEIAVNDRYLPAAMSDDDVRALVAGAIAASGASSKADLGKVMKTVMAENQGKVDGKTVQRIAAELLP
jgi:uncharacterized protein YqeY